MRTAAVAVVSCGFGVAVMVISGSPIGLLSSVGAWMIADRTVERAALQAERDRAVALLAEVEASRQARQEAAAVEERGRIAREMHDVLAHSLAGLSMQLQAVRSVAVREGASAALTGPLDRAADLARDGVQEARAAVGRCAPRRRGRGRPEDAGRGFPDRPVSGWRAGWAAGAGGGPRDLPGGAGGHDERGAVRHRQPDRGGRGVVGRRTAGRRTGPRPPGRTRPVRGAGSGTGLRGMAERIEAAGARWPPGRCPASRAGGSRHACRRRRRPGRRPGRRTVRDAGRLTGRE
ncbi:histidine kinase [Streptomyces sp. M19]